ncbi:MAG: hypothetical protein WC334_10585 [Kiritimatiellales bacterium]|jgi:hypothetical protein
MRCCDELKEIYKDAQVSEITELKDKLIEIDANSMTWTTTFKCQKCGQKWAEKFVQRGHGEIPEVYKVA